MSVFRIVYLGTPDFAVAPLECLLADAHFKVALVVSQPDRPAGRSMQLQASPVKQLAVARGIPVVTPEKINTPEVLEQIRAVSADSAVVVAFGQILSNEFLNIFPLRAVNVHASLLPRWRGAAPIQRALYAGDAETGVALQVIVQKLDAGAVLGIRKIELTDDIDASMLYERMKPLACELLSIDYVDYLRGNLMPTPQDESSVTIAKKIKKEEGLIDWNLPARQILNRYRGLYAWPGSWTLRQSKTLKILKMEIADEDRASSTPARVAGVEDSGLVIDCSRGSLKIMEVQPESRKRQTIGEYLKGYPLKVGDRLGE